MAGMLERRDRDYLETLSDRITELTAQLDELTTTRDDAIRLALDGTAGPTELARIFGLTRARIYQIRDHRR
jgi:hypothetical protein